MSLFVVTAADARPDPSRRARVGGDAVEARLGGGVAEPRGHRVSVRPELPTGRRRSASERALGTGAWGSQTDG
jgi:hypothetical protein